MAKFDLHLHSIDSDGSATVEELVETAVKSGLEIFALTDHDTIIGVNEAEEYTPQNIHFIKGIELTCRIDDIKCHILGYNINPENKDLLEFIELGKKLRRQKLETRIKFLKEVWNIELTKEELDWLYARNSIVKTHFANILVKRGLANDNIEAMNKYFDGCKTGNTRFDGRQAIKIILGAGGTPVWAHPLGGEGEEHIPRKEFIQKLETMIQCGIQGLECYYSRYTMEECEFLVKCAKENNLLITGGSDWHGTNKTVEIGQLNSEGIEIDSDKITLL